MGDKQKDSLWGYLTLPAWDAEELYRLWLIHAASKQKKTRPLTPPEADHYSRQLMILIAARFRHHGFFQSLPKRGLDPSDVAQSALAACYKRTATMVLTYPCYRTLLDNLHQLIRCSALDAIRRHQRPELLASDYASDQTGLCTDPIDNAFAAAHPAPTLRHLLAALRDAEVSSCRAVPGGRILVGELYLHLARKLISNNDIVKYADLPGRLKEGICREQHSLLADAVKNLVRGGLDPHPAAEAQAALRHLVHF